MTCSVGICHFPSGAKNTSDLFEFADNALYMAKQSGRNQVCDYTTAAKPDAGGAVAHDGVATHANPTSGPIGSTDGGIALSPAALARLAASARSRTIPPSEAPELDAVSEGETGALTGFATTNLLVVDEDDPLAAMMG